MVTRTGTNANDSIPFGEPIFVFDGDDFLIGMLGDDQIWGYGGDDQIAGDFFPNGAAGGAGGPGGLGPSEPGGGNDTLYGLAGSDQIWGGAGNDFIYGNGGLDSNETDWLEGNAGDDTIDGSGGTDFIWGDWGYSGGPTGTGLEEPTGGADKLYGAGGGDIIHGGAGRDEIYGHRDPLVFGTADFFTENDELYGEAGNDSIYGQAGNDVIVGGDGYDSLYGGLGRDIFRFDTINDFDDFSVGGDRIYDFNYELTPSTAPYGDNPLHQDLINLSGLAASFPSLTFIGSSAFSQGGGAELNYVWTTGLAGENITRIQIDAGADGVDASIDIDGFFILNEIAPMVLEGVRAPGVVMYLDFDNAARKPLTVASGVGVTQQWLSGVTGSVASFTDAEETILVRHVQDIFANSKIPILVTSERPEDHSYPDSYLTVRFAAPTSDYQLPGGGSLLGMAYDGGLINPFDIDQFDVRKDGEVGVFLDDTVDLNFIAQVVAHEAGHGYGLRHIDPNPTPVGSTYWYDTEVMDYNFDVPGTFWRNPAHVREAPTEATANEPAGQYQYVNGRVLDHNPTYHLLKYALGYSPNVLGSLAPGLWDRPQWVVANVTVNITSTSAAVGDLFVATQSTSEAIDGPLTLYSIASGLGGGSDVLFDTRQDTSFYLLGSDNSSPNEAYLAFGFGDVSAPELLIDPAEVGIREGSIFLFDPTTQAWSSVGSFELTVAEGDFIGPPPSPPDAADDAASTNERTWAVGNVLLDNGAGPDSDVDNDPLTINALNGSGATLNQWVALSSGARVFLDGYGNFYYDPNHQFDALETGESATDSFSYTVSDGVGGTDTATVTVTINGITNVAPVAADDAVSTTTHTQPYSYYNVFSDNGAGPDTDSNGDRLTTTALNGDTTALYRWVSLPSGARLYLDGSGNAYYDPNRQFDDLRDGQTATDSFEYTVSDGFGGTDTASVIVTINGVTNVAPVAADDAVSTDETTQIVRYLFGDNGFGADTDANGDPLKITELNGQSTALNHWFAIPSGALVYLDSFGSMNYRPNGAFNHLSTGETATDVFSYTISDGFGGFDTADVTITINGYTNHVPDTVDDEFWLLPNATFSANFLADNGSGADSDADNDPLTVTAINGGAVQIGATVSLASGALLKLGANGAFSYDPNGQFDDLVYGQSEIDSFTYTVSDTRGGSQAATVTLRLEGPFAFDGPVGSQLYLNFHKNYAASELKEIFVFGDAGDQVWVHNNAGFDQKAVLNGQGFASVKVPDAQAMFGTGINDLGFQIESNGLVSAYFSNRAQYTSDVTIVFERQSLGQDYVLAAYGDQFLIFGEGGQFSVQATEDATAVDVTLVDGQTFSVSLDSGQTFKFATGDAVGNAALGVSTAVGFDLSGTRIHASAPVAVFSGCEIVDIGSYAGDHIVEQMPRIDDLSTYYLVGEAQSPTGLGGNLVRVVATSDATEVKVNGAVVATLDASKVFDFILSDPAAEIETNQPVLVAQYLRGQDIAGEGDPAIMFVPGQDKWLKSYVVAAPSGAAAFSQNLINLIVPTAALDSLKLNGSAVDTSGFSQVGASDFSVGNVSVQPGIVRVEANAAFQLSIFGYGFYDSYLTFGGASFARGVSNAPPVAADDAFATAEDATLSGTVLNANGGAADSDPDGDALTVTALNGDTTAIGVQRVLASGSLLTLNANGTFTYDPNGKFDDLGRGATASDSFTYEITDEGGAKDTAAVAITINGLNADPSAKDDVLVTAENAVRTGNVLADNGAGADGDADGDALSVSALNGDTTAVGVQKVLASGALLTLNENGTFTYDPNGKFDALEAGQTATDGFDYAVSDGFGGFDTAHVTITIDGVHTCVPVVGTKRSDYLKGTDNEDCIFGRDGNDTIKGRNGDDQLDGENGNDSVYGDGGNDLVQGGNGEDCLFGGIGDDDLLGGVGCDRLTGDDGDDFLDGGVGEDQLSGGKGSDTLYGGLNNDLLSGGYGADRFIFDGSSGRDVVTDFVKGVDTLEILGVDASAITIQERRGTTTITYGDNKITLQNVKGLKLSDIQLVQTLTADDVFRAYVQTGDVHTLDPAVDTHAQTVAPWKTAAVTEDWHLH